MPELSAIFVPLGKGDRAQRREGVLVDHPLCISPLCASQGGERIFRSCPEAARRRFHSYQTDSGSKSSSTLPWLSANESSRTPTLSSRVR